MEFSNNSFAIPYNCATSEGNIWANYSSGSGPPPPPQVIIVQAPKLRRSFDGYASRAALMLGVGQVSLGVLSILLGIANPLTCGLYGMVGFGIWSGVIVSNIEDRQLRNQNNFKAKFSTMPLLNSGIYSLILGIFPLF